MSRGPPPKSAIDAVLPVAWARGYVTICTRERGSVCNLIIHAETYTGVVQVVRTRKLHGSIDDTIWQHREHLARLRLIPAGLCRSLELWACSQYGGIRFFRLTATGMIELTRAGDPKSTGDGKGGKTGV